MKKRIYGFEGDRRDKWEGLEKGKGWERDILKRNKIKFKRIWIG